MKQTLAIIDLGGQYCHLISRRLRELGLPADVHGHEVKASELGQYAGIILSGGPSSVYEAAAPHIDARIHELGVPVLGICYGHQLLAAALGGTVARGRSEFGESRLSVQPGNELFDGTPGEQTVWMSHSDSVSGLPPSVQRLGSTQRCDTAAFADVGRRLYGVQFHPEVDHTEHGQALLENFGVSICGLTPRDLNRDRVERRIESIRAKVDKGSVFFLVSGGVDSTVAFVLCARALGRDRVLGLYVDTGLMRKGETDELRATLESLGMTDRLVVRDESERFLDALCGVSDPEEKRHIIGR